jgi:hypothetical protein
MTFVGKILVLVIMAFSLIFLGFAGVVFTASKNWRTATQEEQKKVGDLKKKLTDAQADAGAAKKELEDEKAKFAASSKVLEDRLSSQDAEIKNIQSDLTAARNQVVTAQENSKSALAEVEAKRQEALLLRQQKSAVEKQANEYKLFQADLNDKIRELDRGLNSATTKNTDLRERVAKFSMLLREHGLSDDISQIKGLQSPPPVQGEVKRIDPTNRRMELTIGSDDGLVVGHELYLYRLSPRPEYLGRVKIQNVDPDQAVATVVGHTNQGKKIREGDIVSSTIKPRF